MNNNITNLSADNLKLLKEYKTEAYSHLADIETANQELKLIVEAAAEKTGIEKKVVSQWFKLAYKAKTEEYLSQAAIIEVLNS